MNLLKSNLTVIVSNDIIEQNYIEKLGEIIHF